VLRVFICEDNPEHLGFITKCIEDYISNEKLAMKVVCATASPFQTLDYLRQNRAIGLYFLDVDLSCEMTGIQLAETIRTYDPRGFIVFITADANSLVLTFKYKVEAMDYIVKDSPDLNDRICDCIRNALNKSAKSTPLQNNFIFKLSKDTNLAKSGRNLSKDSVISVDYSKILYFVTSPSMPHNVVIYSEQSRNVFRGSLTQIEQGLDSRFIRCHRSFVVNAEKVTAIDSKMLKLHLVNGETIDVASRYVRAVKERMKHKE